MGPRPTPTLSPAEFLADVEEPVTDRQDDPLGAALPGSPVTTTPSALAPRSALPMSDREFRALPDFAGPRLAASGVTATYATTFGRMGHDGDAWISVTSRWGDGRLVRRDDGSFSASAFRYPDGQLVLRSRGETVTERDFNELIDAIGAASPLGRTRPSRH